MKQYFQNIFSNIKSTLFLDQLNFYIFFSSLGVLLCDLIVWKIFISGQDVSETYRIPISPISYLTVILVINTVLSVSAHSDEEEAETSQLLLSASLSISIFVLVLEIFYMVNYRGI